MLLFEKMTSGSWKNIENGPRFVSQLVKNKTQHFYYESAHAANVKNEYCYRLLWSHIFTGRPKETGNLRNGHLQTAGICRVKLI